MKDEKLKKILKEITDLASKGEEMTRSNDAHDDEIAEVFKKLSELSKKAKALKLH